MWELGKVGFPSFPKRGKKVVASQFDKGKVHTMDCIICTKEFSIERTVLRQLAKKMWTGCEEGQDGWEASGETLIIAIHFKAS
jgi:hypothetical protein